jgi:hypothetical protein
MRESEVAELCIVEALEPFPHKLPVRPAPKINQRPVITPVEALKALRATKGAAAVIERLPGLEEVARWNEVAYWGVCERSGQAADVAFLWDCDFPGSAWSLFDGYANCIAYFAGADELGQVVPPPPSGQVWCYMESQLDAYYIFVVQVQTYLDQYYAPDYRAIVHCYVDLNFIGTRTLVPGDPAPLIFLVHLGAGQHRFDIRQIQGGVFFEGLTAYQLPVEHIPIA